MRFNCHIPESSYNVDTYRKRKKKERLNSLITPTRSPSSSLSSSTPTPTPTPTPTRTPKEELQWVPLLDHPVFTAKDVGDSSRRRFPSNQLAWDGDSRLYFWDSDLDCLHRLSVRLADPEPDSVFAASPSKILKADVEIDFIANKISINRSRSMLLLGGSDGIYVLCLYGCNSTNDGSIICRTFPVGNEVYQKSNSAICILQVMWHPFSDTHLAILSSDSVLRIFDLSAGLDLPEQEYYLQPVARSASSTCPVDFSFGRDHLWDRFSVFVLFSDGSVYTLCPVAPFESLHSWKSILEIYNDAQTFGQKSTDSVAFSNSSRAISWLEATFPELNHQGREASHSISVVKARPFVLIDSPLSLQGPLRKVFRGEEDDPGYRGAECSGRAVSFLYNFVGKDSILVTAWSGGQLQIDALTDEIQPLWNTGKSGNPPRLSFDSQDSILRFAMICDSIGGQLSVVRLDQPLDYWSGHPPPLLRLAMVDLALSNGKVGDSIISMYIDPLIPERIYCLHHGGVDSIVLHFLPFTHQASGKGEMMKTPSVHPVVSTCSGSASLCGFVILSDSLGYSWFVGVTSTRECIVLETKTLNTLHHIGMDADNNPTESEEGNRSAQHNISRELLVGPKVVMVPQGSNLQSVAADSIDGRTTLHHYFNLFHENYVEYAHKVYIELEQRGPLQKKLIDSLLTRLPEAQHKLVEAEKKQRQLDDRHRCAIQRHESLNERLHMLRKLPGIRMKPLTRAEREFKADLDNFAGVELDSLHSLVEALNGRLRKFLQSRKGTVPNHEKTPSRKNIYALDSQLTHLKTSLEKLSLVNSESSKMLKLVESTLKGLEK